MSKNLGLSPVASSEDIGRVEILAATDLIVLFWASYRQDDVGVDHVPSTGVKEKCLKEGVGVVMYE